MSSYLSDIENVIWDWNGTLLDDVVINKDVLNSMMKKRNMNPIDLTEYRDLFCFPITKLYNKIGFDLNKESFEDISHEYHATYTQQVKSLSLTRQAIDVLREIHRQGIRQYVLSACEHNILIDAMSQFDILPLFTKIYGINNIHAGGKTELGKQLMKENILIPKRTLLIGDTLHDAEVAETLGIRYLLFAGGHNNYQMLSRKGKVISNLSEIVR